MMELAEKQVSYTAAEEKVYQVALSMVPHVGGAVARQLISYCGSASKVFNAKARQLQRIPGVGNKIITSIRNSSVLEKARQETENCAQRGVQIISYTDPGFPFRLQQIYDAPIVIYYKGTADLDQTRVISIVGTRKATAYGRRITEELIASLAPYNVLIVSGLAYGIDIYAHRFSLTYGLPTVGVMASGLDIIYPAVHRKDAMAMLHQGGLLTEHPLGCKPDARKFPARNRLIAGLADATIVVEAAERGGALITANLANDYDREVFAVPGSLHQAYSKGCNYLIRNHKARILITVEDIVAMLNWDQQRFSVKPESACRWSIDDFQLDDQEKAVAMLLVEYDEGLRIDEISWKAHVPIHQISSVLLQLEFKGVVKAYPGKKFKIVYDRLTTS